MATLGSVAKTAAPKVGRTLGTLNSKKVALGTTASVGQNLTDRIQNAQGKIQELGGDVPKPKTTALGWLLENLPRTGYGAANMIRELLQSDEGLTPGEFDPLAAWMRGFKKVEQPLGKDIMTGFGLEGDKAMLTGGDPHIYNPSAAGLAGLLLDIFNPTDPINWIGFGLGNTAKSGGLKGAAALEKSFGKTAAANVSKLVGEEAIADIGSRSVGRILKQVTEKGKKIGLDEEGMKGLVNSLKEGMAEAGTNPKTKVNYWQGKPITVGLQNPFTLGLKGNFAEVAVPGSEHLTGAVSKGINKFKQTRVGDTLGEMFQVGYTSKDAPQKLFVRNASQDLDKLVKQHKQGKIKLPVSSEEMTSMRGDLDKISLINVYDTNTASGGINFELMAGIVGADSSTLMNLFDNHLPFTYNLGELFQAFKKAGAEDSLAFRQSFMLRGVMDKMVDLIPNQYRGLFKGTVMTPGIGVEYYKGTLADNIANIRGASSPYINYIFDRHGVGIAIPVNVGENFNKDMWKKLDEALKAVDSLPPEVRKKIIEDVQVTPHNLGEYTDPRTGVKSVDAEGMTLHNQITLADPERMMGTLKHESGHIIWEKNPELANKYVEAAQQEIVEGRNIGVTQYSYNYMAATSSQSNNLSGSALDALEKESFKEDFAESVYRLLSDPQGFMAEHPLRSQVIQGAVYDGSITPEELKAIASAAESRASKISKAYGAEKQLDSILSKIDETVEDIMMNGPDDMVETQMATKQFTRDITRVFEKSLSNAEDYRQAVKAIWKDVSPEESKEIIRIASELDSPTGGPSFYSAINDRLNPTYYSRLRQVVDEKMSNSMPVKDLKNMLKSNGVKDEEIKWTFLDEFFDAKGGKVTKADVQEWLDWNNLEVQEIMKRSTAEQARAKELLDQFGDESSVDFIGDLYEELTDRDDILKAIADEYNLSIEDADLLETSLMDPEYLQELPDGDAPKWGRYTEPGGKDYREIVFTLPLDYNTPKTGPEPISSLNGPAYTEPSHWRDVNNPVAHARFNTRYTPEGKKILFIEELQSDWHQEGWAKGYQDKGTITQYEKKYKELKAKRNKRYYELLDDMQVRDTGLKADEIKLSVMDHPEIEAISQEIRNLAAELDQMIPDAPFKNTWRGLTLKRLVKYASEEGFDGISWTSGAQQNKRWGGGDFRLSYDERIPQDMKKLTKRFKLKIEDINLGKSPSELIDQLKAMDDGGGVDVISEFVDRFTESGAVEENLLTDIVDNFLIVANRNELSPSEAEALSEYIITQIKREIELFTGMGADEIHGMPYVKGLIRSATNKKIKLSDDYLPPMVQKGIMFTDEAKGFFRENAFPLFKKTNNIDPDIQNVDEAISHLSEEAQNAFREFIKWRESIVKEYQKRDIPINVLEKYVPFVFTRKGNVDEMLALNALFGTGSMPEADNLSSLINWLSDYDPNLRPRTTQATNPAEVNKILSKPILSEDGAVIMATRGTRSIQAMELYDFAEDFMSQYGRTVDEMAEYGNLKGYSLYKPKTTPDGRRVFEKMTSAGKIMEGDPSTLFLPDELAKIYNDYTDLIFGKQGMNKLLKTYDKATSLYKKLAYLWNPGHIMRDFTGNVFNGYLMGLTNPKYYKEAFDYMTNPDMLVKVPGFQMSAKDFVSKCRQNGVLDIGSALAEFAGDPIVGIKKTNNPAMKALNGYGWAMRMGTRQSDTFTRLAGMIYQLRQGRSFDEAAVMVKKFYFDYFELTSFERNVMKRIIPFYTWMRKNIPLQLEMMIKNPRELARISDAMNAAAGEPINWSEQPEYIQEAGAFPLGNLNHYLSPNLPYSDLSRGIPNFETAKNWLSAVNPIIRAPIELTTNTQWFNGRPIENYGGEQRDLPLAGLLRSLGIETPTVSKRGAGYLADQIPLLRNLDAVTNPDNPRQMEKASTFLGGPGLYKKDAVQTSSQYEYLKLLQDLIRLLQEQNQNIIE